MKKKKKEKMTKKKFLVKFFRFILISYILVIIISTIISNTIKKQEDIVARIGTNEPYSISIKDALYIKAYCIEPYIELLKESNYQEAYKMLTTEFQEVTSYEEYLNSIQGIDFNTFEMKNIKMKAEGTYVADIMYKRNDIEEETKYLLYVSPYNSEVIAISPNQFIYSYNNLNFKIDKLELNIQECNINIDSVKLKMRIKNKATFENVKISSIGVGYSDAANREETVELLIKPGEEKEVEINYETNYYVPNNIKIKRILEEDTIRTYTLYFKDADKK